MGIFKFFKKKKKEESPSLHVYRVQSRISDLQTALGSAQTDEERERISQQIDNLRKNLEAFGWKGESLGGRDGRTNVKLRLLNEEIDQLDEKMKDPKIGYSEYETLSQELDQKIAERNLKVRRNLPSLTPQEQKELGLEKDREGKILLYHLSPKKFREKIIREGLKPPGELDLYEVKVSENNLMPDEDTGEDNWKDSLRSLGLCSYRGNIESIKLV
jgi:hypothetical protein